MARAVSFTQAGGELTIRNARIVFGPSTDNDDNDCPRKNIVLKVDDTTASNPWLFHSILVLADGHPGKQNYIFKLFFKTIIYNKLIHFQI